MALTIHMTFLGSVPTQHIQGITSSAYKSYLSGNPAFKSSNVPNLTKTLNCSCRSRSNMTGQRAEKNNDKIPHVLSVAGSDSGAGAGIQADMKACGALGVYCSTVITAVTAQNTVGVQGVHPVPENFVFEQLRSVLSDMEVDVVKTGMLPSTGIIQALCRSLREYPVRALVVDPVMVATSGDVLASPSILNELRTLLMLDYGGI